MVSGLHVLYVDDDPDGLDLRATLVERTAATVDVTTASSAHDGIDCLEASSIDCVVSGDDLPEMGALEFLEIVRERDPTLPFILFPENGSEALASEAISAGVTDYVRRGADTDQHATLVDRIDTAVENCPDDRSRNRSDGELERYRTLVETAVDPMYALDESGVCLLANEALADFLGCERDELVGNRLEAVVDGGADERGIESLAKPVDADRDRDSLEVAVEHDDGTERIGEVHHTVLVDDGVFDGSVGVVRDISARKARERAQRTYERIVAFAPTALFTLDETGTISWSNDEFAEPFDESKTELLGTSFGTLVDRGYYDDRVTRTYADQIRTLLSSETETQRATYSVRFRSSDGSVEIHDVHTQLLPLEDGEFAGTIHAVRDSTQRRRQRRELERQNDRLEKFASLVSHDLRNPLNVAQGSLEIHSKSCGEVDDHVERVHDSLDRMNDLIDDLLSLARHGRTVGEPDVVSLSQLSRDAWNAVETGDSTLVLEAEGTILADAGRAQELLENLFRNAVEHGGDGLTVTVDTLADDDAMETGLVVADDGAGFPDGEPTEALFEFGHTTSESGTGLGLAIVREIADAHGWTTTATDSAAGGARFEFRDITVGADRDSAPAPADTDSSADADPPAGADPPEDTDRH